MQYRFYLLDVADRFEAAEVFVAQHDREAAEVVAWVYAACSDAFHGYELWRGTERVVKQSRSSPSVRELVSFEIAMAHRATILDLVDRLEGTFPCVRTSQTLPETIARLRNARAPVGSGPSARASSSQAARYSTSSAEHPSAHKASQGWIL